MRTKDRNSAVDGISSYLRGGWRNWATIGAILLAVVVPALAAVTMNAGAALEQRLLQLRRHGEPIALSDVYPKPVPEEINAAACYQQAFAKLDGPEHSRALRYYIVPETSQDERTRLEPRVRELIEQNKDVFPLVKQATERPQCQFTVDWQAAGGADWSYIDKLEHVSDLLNARAVIEAEDGKTGSAVGNVVLALRVARATDSDPFALSFISELSRRAITIWSLRQVTRSRALTFEQAKVLFDELARSSVISVYKRTERGQRALVNYYFTLLRGGRENMTEQMTPGLAARQDPMVSHIYDIAGTVTASRIYKDQISYLDLYERELTLIDEPYSETVKAMKTMKVRDYPFTVNWGGPFFSLVSTFHTTAEINGAQTAMALMAYKSRFGHYPAKLDEAAAALGWELPLDPYTRDQLSYRQEGDRFELRSGAGEVVWKSEQ